MRFSTHDPAKLGEKYRGRPCSCGRKPRTWSATSSSKSGFNYIEVPNEAAFYGPKIDVQVWSTIGREFTLATNQVDFARPGAVRTQIQNARKHRRNSPVHPPRAAGHSRAVHRLPDRTLCGQFSALWLSPEQVRVLPIGDEEPLVEYGQGVVNELRAQGVRATMDASSDKINGKVLRAEQMKVHTMLVVGRRDLEAGNVSVRVHGQGNVGARKRRGSSSQTCWRRSRNGGLELTALLPG